MERITGKEVKIMMEALHQVYAQPEEQVEVVSEEVQQLDEAAVTNAKIAAGAEQVRRQRQQQQAAQAKATAAKIDAGEKLSVNTAGPLLGALGARTTVQRNQQGNLNVLGGAGGLDKTINLGGRSYDRLTKDGKVTYVRRGATPSAQPPAQTSTSPGPSAPAATTPGAKTPPTAPVTTQYQKDRAAIATAKTPEEKAAATKTAETSGMAAWAKANPALAAKVKPGQAGYDTIQKTLNPQKTTAATTATNTAAASSALSGTGALSTKPAPVVGKPVPGAKPVPTGTPIQGGIRPVAGAPTASAAGTKFGVATPAAQSTTQAVQSAGTTAAAKPTTNQTGTAFSTSGSLAPGANKVMNTPVDQLKKKPVAVANSLDLFDIVKGHLMSEGYADSEEAALAIMANMSEEWRQNILLELTPLGVRAAGAVDDQRRGSTRDKDLKDTADTLRKMRPYPNGFPAVKGV